MKWTKARRKELGAKIRKAWARRKKLSTDFMPSPVVIGKANKKWRYCPNCGLELK